jgi:flagellar biosynthesis/type III secretory pathway chaperone
MRDSVSHLAGCLDDVIDIQERLLDVLEQQRPAIVEGRHREVEALSQRTEIEIRRLQVAERVRAAAAQIVADELGLATPRWSVMRAALTEDELPALEERVGVVEELVRDLEMANAINGQLVRQELEVMDASVRSLIARPAAGYTAAGISPAAPATGPVMLNTSA